MKKIFEWNKNCILKNMRKNVNLEKLEKEIKNAIYVNFDLKKDDIMNLVIENCYETIFDWLSACDDFMTKNDVINECLHSFRDKIEEDEIIKDYNYYLKKVRKDKLKKLQSISQN